MNEEITKLAREYTQETANLKNYQCQAKSAIYGRQLARTILKEENEPYYICDYLCAVDIAKVSHIEIEQCDHDDHTEYIWALVPEYNSYGHAKVVLRRVGTEGGELLLPPEKRAEKRLKLSDREEAIIRKRSLKGIVEKIKNYEAQIKDERKRMTEQIRKGDKVYMEAEAVALKRICAKMQEELDDFLDLLLV